MQAVKKALVGSAAVAGLLVLLGASPAMATPTSFTWDPNAATSGATHLSTPGSQFTASNITIKDYALINLGTNSGTALAPVYDDITENAILSVYGFDTPNPPGFINGGGGGSSTGAYELYFDVTATSHLAGTPGALFGDFDTLSFTLFGDVGGKCTFAATTGSGVTSNCYGDTQIAIATGDIVAEPTNFVDIIAGIPGADVTTDMTADAGESGFFVSPNLLDTLFEAAFTNTSGAVSRSGNKIAITGGGGDITASVTNVPEPITLSLFGAGLAGAAAMRRRRSKKA